MRTFCQYPECYWTARPLTSADRRIFERLSVCRSAYATCRMRCANSERFRTPAVRSDEAFPRCGFAPWLWGPHRTLQVAADRGRTYIARRSRVSRTISGVPEGKET